MGQEATCPSAQTTGKDRKKVLIIDENALERQSLEKALVSSGYSVLACGSGRRALQECLKQDPDLVVLHEEPGDEFSRYASKRLLEGRNGPPIPVILILPKAKERNVPASGVEGVAAVFPHPVADEVLLSAIEKALLHGWMRQPHTLEDIVRSIAESRGVLGDGQAKGSGNGGLEHMAHRIGEHLRDEILLAVRPLSSDGPERLLQALTERVLSRAVLGRLAHEASELAADMQAQGLLSNSSTISFPDLLQALSQRRVTGILTISARGNKLDVLLRDGSIVFLNPRAIDLSAFGETLHCSYHAFPVAHVAEALAKSSCEDDSLFYYLGEDRKISPEEVPEIMASLGLEILSRCVLQEEDFRFQFRHREALGERFIQHDLELPAQRLLLKLSTRLDEWRALQKPSLDGEATRFAATDGRSTEIVLTEKQSLILRALAKPRTIPELSASCLLSPFEVWRGLARLIEEGLAKKTGTEDPARQPLQMPDAGEAQEELSRSDGEAVPKDEPARNADDSSGPGPGIK